MLGRMLTYLRSVKWINDEGRPNQPYVPTSAEHCANIGTHAIWIVPSIVACFNLIDRSETSTQLLAARLYGITMVLLFLVSTLFHYVCYCYGNGILRNILHRCDRSMIYLFIAGSLCPWAMLLEFPADSISSNAPSLIWVLALTGIAYQQIFHERFKTLETILYCVISIIPAVLIVLECSDAKDFTLIATGGALYLLGLIFFKADGHVPCAHAIWHCFVSVAALLQYLAVSCLLYPDPQPAIKALFSYIKKTEF